ncbi:AMP-binding protein [Thermoactinomyces mirandus]|uniref:AMP-binding protein n=1 Tax=Thermoactinomyces mirandus TaxID=2756294 RepID=A0A7W1XP74_9BACL|nr:AMP-binding protein [Thermoactinomyces mirandus]MBA4600738.1 AMP-binding protein [Thermoactinomyces mirandus]
MYNGTLGDLLDQQVQLYGHKEAVIYPEKGIRWTFGKFQEEVCQAAKGLIRLGIRKGDHLSIWASNQPEWLIMQFATGKMGAVFVTVNTSYRTHDLEFVLKQSDTETLVLEEEVKGVSFVEMLYEVCPELKQCQPGKLVSEKFPKLKNVILLSDHRYRGMYCWKDLIEMGKEVSDEELKASQASLHPHDVINMQYTSGTTGFPKGVMLSHHNIINNARNIAECMKLTEKDRLCIPVPFFHCFGSILGTLACFSVGASIVPLEVFDAGKVLDLVEQEKCTGLHGVPTMFISELNHPSFRGKKFPHLRTGIMAGSNCPAEIMRQVTEDMGIRELTIAYGQTESSPVITQTRTDDSFEIRINTVGRPHPHVEVKIVDPATGKALPDGEQGELCTRGYHVMKGYYKMPDATREVIDEEGWLHTGDLAVRNEDGTYKITGRLKDMIIRGGENIYPREIEEFLYKHPKILDSQIVGVPDEKYGEIAVAFVRKKAGVECGKEEIVQFCKGKIANYKIPSQVIFVEEYPVTANGKIQKYKLREAFIKKYQT